MSNTFPPPPPPGGQDPQQPQGAPPPQGGQAPPPPPPAYGDQQQGGYGAMPGAPVPTGPVAAATRPPAMENAVKLMRLGGLLSLLSLLTLFFTTGSVRDAVEETAPAGSTQAEIDAAVSLSIGFAVVFALFGVALWFWMAAMNGKGKSWARVVATVFFGIQVVSFLFSFTQAQPIISRLISVIMVAIGAGAIYFMYRPESSQFYQASSRPQY